MTPNTDQNPMLKIFASNLSIIRFFILLRRSGFHRYLIVPQMDTQKFVIPAPSFEIPPPVDEPASPAVQSPMFRRTALLLQQPPSPLRSRFSGTPVKANQLQLLKKVTIVELSETSLINDVAALPGEDEAEQPTAEGTGEEEEEEDGDGQNVE
jgi:hypothetical protein